MSLGCKVCDDKGAALTIDRYLEQGLTYAVIARSLTLAGFDVGAPTISKHDKHRAPSVAPEVRATKRDAAAIIKGKVLDRLEGDPDIDILDRNLQAALGTALKAQGLEDKREQKKVTQNFWLSVGGAIQGVPALDDGMTIEGEAVEVVG